MRARPDAGAGRPRRRFAFLKAWLGRGRADGPTTTVMRWQEDGGQRVADHVAAAGRGLRLAWVGRPRGPITPAQARLLGDYNLHNG